MSASLFGVGVAGPALAPSEREILAAIPPRGVILFRRNLESLDGLSRLTAELRELGPGRRLEPRSPDSVSTSISRRSWTAGSRGRAHW